MSSTHNDDVLGRVERSCPRRHGTSDPVEYHPALVVRVSHPGAICKGTVHVEDDHVGVGQPQSEFPGLKSLKIGHRTVFRSYFVSLGLYRFGAQTLELLDDGVVRHTLLAGPL